MPRTREFDADRALDNVTRLFWEKGYEATSIQDLVDATGVNRASLYHTFGGKEKLFALALQRFQHEPQQNLALLTARTSPGLARIRETFRLAGSQTLAEPRGCLVLNSVALLAPHDPAACEMGRRSREHTEAFFYRALCDAARLGEIPPHRNRRALARFLANALLGLRITAKMRPHRALVRDIVATTLAVLAAPR